MYLARNIYGSIDGHLELSHRCEELRSKIRDFYRYPYEDDRLGFFLELNDRIISVFTIGMKPWDNYIIDKIKYIVLKCIALGIICNGRFILWKYPESDVQIRIIDNVIDEFSGTENIYGKELEYKIHYDPKYNRYAFHTSLWDEMPQLAERMRCKNILRSVELLCEDVIQYISQFI